MNDPAEEMQQKADELRKEGYQIGKKSGGIWHRFQYDGGHATDATVKPEIAHHLDRAERLIDELLDSGAPREWVTREFQQAHHQGIADTQQ